MKRSPLNRSTPMPRGNGPKRSAPKKRRAVSPASPAQREKMRGRGCLVCAREPVHPAHLIDRSIGGDDNALAVVALCPEHHRAYDEGSLSLLEHLEPWHREEVAHAVMTVGLVMALQRLTNEKWTPVES